ncbi:MAG: hypothetical protein EPO35_13410 [Acidobacteria bacterium]|nr:MAG: hypothetical protein EPO35_13410 [Acidobacteriota bacterium]
MKRFSRRVLGTVACLVAAMFGAASVCEARQARRGPQAGWICRADRMSRPCRGAGCESSWRDHVRRYHHTDPPQVQQQLQEPVEQSSDFRPPATLGQAYVRGVGSMTGLGVLLASLKTDSNGANQWRKGLVAGPAIGVMLVTAVNARSIPAKIRIPLMVGSGLIAGGAMFGGAIRW